MGYEENFGLKGSEKFLAWSLTGTAVHEKICEKLQSKYSTLYSLSVVFE